MPPEVKASDIFTWSPDKDPLIMKRTGVNNAFSLPLFCNHHDTSIFSHIETDSLVLTDYKTQLLLSYRVVCAEIRKKEISVEFFTRVINANTLTGQIDKDSLETFLEGTKLGINDLTIYKELLEEEIENEENKCVFQLFLYPLIKVFASATFSPIDLLTTDPKQEDPFNAVYIHIIPYDGNLNIIVGYHRASI